MHHVAFCFPTYAIYLCKLPEAKSPEMGSMVIDFYSHDQCYPGCSISNSIATAVVDIFVMRGFSQPMSPEWALEENRKEQNGQNHLAERNAARLRRAIRSRGATV